MDDFLAQQLARRFCALSYRDIPQESLRAMKRLLLDYLGVALAGSRTASARIAARFAWEQGGAAQASLIGCGGARVPAANAALANAIAAHSIELDDIDVLALFHFSPPVFSAGLAAAEQAHASGRRLLAALAAGCEMMERASRAANPALRNRGFHTTPACGVFGATVAAGKLLGLDVRRLAWALGLAGAQASGLMEMYGPSMQKRFNPGPAARAGVTAAAMARLGFSGAETIFEGERGFLRAFAGEADPTALGAGLEEPYRLEVEFKPYACARPIHNAIDCALEIRRRHRPDLGAIRRIEVARHPDWAHYHRNAAPRTYHEAQVSLPYSVAVALKEGQALLEQYRDRKLADPVLRRLCALTEITVDGSLPRGVSCRMTVTLEDGRRLVSQVDHPKGSVANPLSDEELRRKFERLAAPVVGAERAARIAQTVETIERCEDVARLMRLAAPPARGRKRAA